MTTHYFGADLGDSMKEEVAIDTSTTSDVIELAVITSTSGLTKSVALEGLEAIRQAIIAGNWPPS